MSVSESSQSPDPNQRVQPAELVRLCKKRNAMFAKLTRFKNFLNDYPTKPTILELRRRFADFETILGEFRDIQGEIDMFNTVFDIEINSAFEDEYFSLCAEAEQFIQLNDAVNDAVAISVRSVDPPITQLFENMRTSNGISNTGLNFDDMNLAQNIGGEAALSQNNRDRVSNSNRLTHSYVPDIEVRLPPLQLPSYSGKYDEWSGFCQSFQSLIGHTNLSDIKKFIYLRSCLTGEAAQTIQNLETNSANYNIAWDLLKVRYENKDFIIYKHLSALFDMSPVARECHVSLRQLSNNLTRHLRALQAYGEPVQHWDTIMMYLMLTKVDLVTRREWEHHKLTLSAVSLKHFTDFLESRCMFLEKLNVSSKATRSTCIQGTQPIKNIPRMKSNTFLSYDKKGCVVCKGSHFLYQCEKFIKLSPQARLLKVREYKLCCNCLRKGHSGRDCTHGNCRKCNGKHNTLLHLGASSPVAEIPAKVIPEPSIEACPLPTPVERIVDNTSTHCLQVNPSQVLLATAVVKAFNAAGQATHHCRILLDSASQSNYIRSSVVKTLMLPTCPVNIAVTGINRASTNIREQTRVILQSKVDQYLFSVDCLVVENITNDLPSASLDVSSLKIPGGISLADPQFYIPGCIDILIGAELFYQLHSFGTISLGKRNPTLQSTRLGWIISGVFPASANASSTLCHLSTKQVTPDLSAFWELEEFASPARSHEELKCEEHFIRTHSRNTNGRFIVRLPFKPNVSELGESRTIAKRMFQRLEQRLEQSEQLKSAYTAFMSEYEGLGHMSENTRNEVIDYFLPHHAVHKADSTTTKTRVVFNGSMPTTSGTSLNDVLMVGPCIQEDIFSILLRFRQHRYVFIADIEKMYRQILVHEEDRPMQQILWRADCSQSLKAYSLNTLTYGLGPSSFIATRCLQQLANENQHKFPHATTVIARDFYMDDLISGADSTNEASRICLDVSTLLSSAGFPLRKWVSNDMRILKSVSDKAGDAYEIDIKETTKTLGIKWQAANDEFHYSVNISSANITKRTILSAISRLYDPIGLLSPLIVKAKIIMQALWRANLGWDDTVPENIRSQWQCFVTSLADIDTINFPRHVICPNAMRVELHGFCDASEKAYGACIYVRSTSPDGTITSRLLASKSRVAPVKTVTLPRLELCGALLLAKLMKRVQGALTCEISQIVLWSDSMITLGWIRSSPSILKTFVSNRVAEIQALMAHTEWRHVSGKDNPADVISRGATLSELLQCDIWWHAPKWLNQSLNLWPTLSVYTVELPELKSESVSLVTSDESDVIHLLINKFSRLTKLLRIMALCLRFIRNLRTSCSARAHDSLSTKEIKIATVAIIKYTQRKHFHEEIHCINRRKPVGAQSKLLNFNPFLDQEAILRVGGRIHNAPLPYEQRHPIVLPSGDKFTRSIIDHYHKQTLHSGVEATLATIRTEYWPISGRREVKRVIKSCVQCFKSKPTIVQPQMGNLPSNRLTVRRPFSAVGVDFAGPFMIKEGVRKYKSHKAYLCLFICMSTKAIHLELVSDLTTAAFIASFRRFIARRGKPSDVYSDNGTNFIGANRELKDLLNSQSYREQVHNFSTDLLITWHFNPPKAANFGGIWESNIKSTKRILQRVVGSAPLNFEQLTTTFTQIEACLNSRPLCPLSSDPNDLSPLTPAHFLIGDSLHALPQRDMTGTPENRLTTFERLQQMLQHFWKRWSKEYISTLLQRQKWKEKKNFQLKVGDLCLLVEETLPNRWPLGRVTDLHPGKDGEVRVITVKTANGMFRRPVNKVAKLPASDDDS